MRVRVDRHFLAILAWMSTCVSAIGVNYRVPWEEGKRKGAAPASEEADNKFKDTILNGMSTWSGGRFKATLGGIGARAVINVEVTQSARRTKNEAEALKDEMMKLVLQNTVARSRSPSPARSGSKSPKPKRRYFRNKKRSPVRRAYYQYE